LLYIKEKNAMKVFINADIEGIAGVGHWEEAIE
jgi:D-aminopeptidase